MPKLANVARHVFALLVFTSCYRGTGAPDVTAAPGVASSEDGAADSSNAGTWVPMTDARPAKSSRPLHDFSIRRDCEMRGAGISHRSVTVTDVPPRAEMRDEKGSVHVRALVAADVAPLAALLSGPAYDRLLKETLPPADPIKNFRRCTITVEAGGTVSTIRWSNANRFTAASQQRFDAIMEQLTHLELRAWRHR